METNKLPQSAWSDAQAAGSQPQHLRSDDQDAQQTNRASNDSSYKSSYKSSNDFSDNTDKANDQHLQHLAKDAPLPDNYFGYKSAEKSPSEAKEPAVIRSYGTKNNDLEACDDQAFNAANGYNHPQQLTQNEPLMSDFLDDQLDNIDNNTEQSMDSSLNTVKSSYNEIPERIFMNALIKHTGIALAIIIPLAAFSAYAATPPMGIPSNSNVPEKTVSATMMASETSAQMIAIKPSAIIHKSASVPTTVDSVDLKAYAGTWYEIGRLPMYFQRNCAYDVTANYTQKTDGSGVIVTNKCTAEDGSGIVAEGIAKPVDKSGSKLKVTFLPSWIRWLPVGRADYWVLARDADYQTALVGNPDKDYLWLLARTPNISQEVYAKYRQIAQQQGYDLKEFKLTAQTKQTVNLVP